MRPQVWACALALAALAVADAQKVSTAVGGVLPVDKGWIAGQSTTFGQTKVPTGPAYEGTCGYGDVSQTLFPRLNVAAVSAVNPGRMCGSCIQVRCLQTNCTTNRPFIVQVVDSCGSKCTPNELQMPVETYTANLAPTTVEPVLVQYRVVDCNPVGDIVVHVAELEPQTNGITMTLAFLSVFGPAYAINGVALQSGRGKWQSIGQVAGNTTALWRGLVTGSAPYSVRLQTTMDQVVQMPNIITKAKVGNYQSNQQLTGYPDVPAVPGLAPLPRQDDLLGDLTGPRASALDNKLAATPTIQKLLLTPEALTAATTLLQLNGTNVAMNADNTYVLQQVTYEMLSDVTSAPVTITAPLAGYGAAATRRMLRAADISTTVGVVVATNSTKDQAAVMQTLGNTIKSGIFPARLNSAGLGVNFMTINFVVPNAAAVTSPASAGVTASDQEAGAPIADASIVTTDDSFPLAGIIGIAVGGGILLLLAVFTAVCCARRQRKAATARKLNAACETESDAEYWHPNPAFERPVYEKPSEKPDAGSGAGLGAKIGGVFGVGKFTGKSVASNAESKDSARGATTIDVHAESPREERCPTPSGVHSRSPSPSPLRWADVRGAVAGAAPYDTPSPKTTHAPSPWTGMLDVLRARSPSPLLRGAQSPGSPPSARRQLADDSPLSPANLEASTPTKDHAPAAAAAATAAATVGAVAMAAVHAVEPSAASEASMGSQPSHLPDEAFCSGDAVPSQSPQPLLFKAEKNPKAPKSRAARSLWGGMVSAFGTRRSPSPMPKAPTGTITTVHVPSEAGSPEPRQPKAVSPDADSPIAPTAELSSPYSERPPASPFSERAGSRLLESPVAAPPSPGAALTLAPLAAGMQDGGSRKKEAAQVAPAEPELPAVSQRQAVVVEAPAATKLQVVKPQPQQLVISELEMAGDSQFVTAASAAKEAVAATMMQPAAEDGLADAAETAQVEEPAPMLESPKPAKQWGMAALKGFLRSPPRADKSADQLALEPSQGVLNMEEAAPALPQAKQVTSPKLQKMPRSPKPVTLSAAHLRTASQTSQDGSPAKSPTPHEPKYAALDDQNLQAREEAAALASPAARRVRIQEGGIITESPKSVGRHVRVPRAGMFDDSPCRSPAGSMSPERGMPRSHRGTPESGTKVPRPYAGGRNDVMPFTAEELMLFKEAQSSASFAGSAGGDSRRSKRSNGSDASRISYHSRATSAASQRPRRPDAGASYAPNADNLRRVAAIPEGVREVLGLPSVPGGPLPGVPRPSSSRRAQRNLFEEALSETGSQGSRKRGSSDSGRHSSSSRAQLPRPPTASPAQKHFK